jgi:hypothetical protein
LIKLFVTILLLEVALNLRIGLSFAQVLLIALTVTAIGYFIGDLIILRLTNNTVATLCDILLAFLTINMFNYLTRFGPIGLADITVASILIGFAEWFLHRSTLRGKDADQTR